MAVGRLEHALQDGDYPIVTEINPVKEENLRHFFRRAELLTRFASVMTVNSLVGREDRVRSVDAAKALVARGFDPMPVVTCRRHDVDGLEDRLTDAWAGGVRSVCVVRGDPPPGVDRADAYGASVLEVIRRISALELDGGRFFLGAGANPARPLEDTLKLSLRKVSAGARFLMTQPAEPTDEHLAFARAMKDRAPDVKILWGLMYVGSVDELDAIERRLGVKMPERTWRRLESAADPAEEGLRILGEDVARVREVPEIEGLDILFFRKHTEMLPRVSGVLNRA